MVGELLVGDVGVGGEEFSEFDGVEDFLALLDGGGHALVEGGLLFAGAEGLAGFFEVQHGPAEAVACPAAGVCEGGGEGRAFGVEGAFEPACDEVCDGEVLGAEPDGGRVEEEASGEEVSDEDHPCDVPGLLVLVHPGVGL